MTLFIFGLICAESLAAEVDPADARIRYVGRWEFSDPSAPWCAWQGASITAKFRGTAIRGEFETGDGAEFVRVLVDGNAATSRKIKLAPARQTYTLASGLVPRDHHVKIIKETYTQQGHLTFHGFEVVGDGLLEITDPRPALRIAFYGDSNLAGVSLEHEKNQGHPNLRGSYYGFAGIASRMLDAEYHNISSGGAKIAGGLNSGMSFYDRVDFYQAKPRWEFDRFPADICVVNLGANDIGSKSKDQIKQDYRRFVKALRQVHPNAHIVLMNGYGWSRKETANYTDEVVEEMKDVRLSRVVFPWLFNEWHGCEYDHAGMAKNLVNHLVSVNSKWKQVRPIDVMDGFGRNGNVANGSFEAVAPFGGYGWRYYTDGAQRMRDPRTSPDGEWFLRLPEGKQVHQPNPASKAKTYTIRLKMRGQQAGDRGRIRIEFRDQEWRHEIPDSSKTFEFALDPTWKDYHMTAKSPASDESLDASWEPWQIIIRLEAESGTVDFDDVRLSSI